MNKWEGVSAIDGLLNDRDAAAKLPANLKDLLYHLRSLLEHEASDEEIRNLCHGILHWYLDSGFPEVAAHTRARDLARALGK